MRNLRFRLACWLIRPEAAKLYRHYLKAKDDQISAGNYEEANNCEYIAIGIRYASGGYRGE